MAAPAGDAKGDKEDDEDSVCKQLKNLAGAKSKNDFFGSE